MNLPPPKTKAQHIASLAAAGYTLIPLRGKIPSNKEWGDTPPGAYGPKEIGEGNYGVVLRAGDLVVDVDPRNFSPGDTPVTRLIAAVGAPLSSYTVRTGGGGLHIYLRKPPDIAVVHTLKDYPGIEFKTLGRQVVGPGSVHPETQKVYEVAAGSASKVSQILPSFLALITRTTPVWAEGGTGAYKNDAGTQGRYAAFLQDTADLSVEGKQGDATAFKTAAFGRDLGLPPATVLDLMLDLWNPRCSPPWEAEELRTKVSNVYRYAQGAVGSRHPDKDFSVIVVDEGKTATKKEEAIAWVLTRQGQPVRCFYNLLNFLRLPAGGLNRVFGLNEFTGSVAFVSPAPWHHGRMPAQLSVTDNDLKLLKGHLAVRHAYEMNIGPIEEAVTVTAHGYKFHPVRDYLVSQKWDGKGRLDRWLIDFGGAEDTAYVRAVSRKTLCAAVARIFRPGCKFDHVLILEGDQGIGKSGICRILGGEWYSDFVIDPHNRDTIASLQGKWLVEMSEMEVTRRAETMALKAFITRQTDKARLAYGRLSCEFPRQCIFIGTINPGPDGTYLVDDTGNRRFWPVELQPRKTRRDGMVDFKGLAAARDQIWAEAVHTVNTEHLYMETARLREDAQDVAALRHAEHPWTERIAAWVDLRDLGVAEASDVDINFLTARGVWVDALGGLDKQLDRRSSVAIAGVMRMLGWHSGVKRQGARVVRGYLRGESARPGPRPRVDPIADLL